MTRQKKATMETQGSHPFLDKKFKDFSRTFKALNFYFKIQGCLRTFKVCANPGDCSQPPVYQLLVTSCACPN